VATDPDLRGEEVAMLGTYVANYGAFEADPVRVLAAHRATRRAVRCDGGAVVLRGHITDADGNTPPVVHLDSDGPLHDADGSP
jgi:hypothetical protein